MFRLLALLLCLISFNASATTFKFFTPWGNTFPTADAACSYTAQRYSATGLNYVYSGSFSISGDDYICNGTIDGQPGVVGRDSWNGDSCPEGTVVDPSGGGCVTPPPPDSCAAKKGKVVKSFHWLSSSDMPSSTISVDGCAAAITGVTICKTASPSVYSCSGTATWSGDVLEGTPGAGNECTGAECTKDDPQDGTKNEPCIKQDTGAGFTCTAKVEDSKAGQTSCGTANGVFVCTPITKPSKTTISSQVSQVQTANSDGSLTTKNVTTTTKTTCVADKCTETKYTTTTSGGTSKDGMPTGDKSECEGSDCPSQTTGGVGGTSGSPSTGEAGASKDCSKPVVCKGDIYQCAILNQEFISMCSAKELPTSKDLSDLRASADKFASTSAANQQTLDQSANSVLNTFKAASSTGGGSTSKCLPDYDFSVAGHSFGMKFSAACDTLSGIRYAILAIAYLLAIRRISMEL